MICRYTEGKRGREREREQRTRTTERKDRNDNYVKATSTFMLGKD